MAQRVYLIPVLHIPLVEGAFYNVPKYFPHRVNPNASPELVGVWFGWETWLNEDTAIIVADVDATQHTFISGRADVVSVPDLDTTVANVSQRNRVRSYLEGFSVPGNWIIVGMTYRGILRIVLGMFQLHNRAVAILGRGVGSGNLDLTVSEIPADLRLALAQAATDLGLDYSAVTPTTTLRAVLKGAGDQFASRSFGIGGLVI